MTSSLGEMRDKSREFTHTAAVCIRPGQQGAHQRRILFDFRLRCEHLYNLSGARLALESIGAGHSDSDL